MKKRNIKYYVIDLLMAAMLITSVFGMAHISLDEAMADGETSTVSFNEISPTRINIEVPATYSRTQIQQELNSVKVTVKYTVSGDSQEYTNNGIIEWGDINNYNQSPTTSYDCTCEGSFPDSIVCGRYTVFIPQATKITANIHVAVSAQYEEFKLDRDGFTATISSKDVKSILNNQKDKDILEIINEAKTAGNPLSIQINVNEVNESKADDDGDIEDKAQEKHSNAKVGKYYKITLQLVVDDEPVEDAFITDTGDTDITFKYTVPKSMKSSSSSSSKGTRYYRVYYHHDGDAHGLEDWDDETTIKFHASKFSTYGIAYYDESSSSSSSRSSSGSGSNSAAGNQTPSTGGGAPKTGDNFNPRIWIYLLIVCATVASAAWILLQDTKDDKEKEDNN